MSNSNGRSRGTYLCGCGQWLPTGAVHHCGTRTRPANSRGDLLKESARSTGRRAAKRISPPPPDRIGKRSDWNGWILLFAGGILGVVVLLIFATYVH